MNRAKSAVQMLGRPNKITIDFSVDALVIPQARRCADGDESVSEQLPARNGSQTERRVSAKKTEKKRTLTRGARIDVLKEQSAASSCTLLRAQSAPSSPRSVVESRSLSDGKTQQQQQQQMRAQADIAQRELPVSPLMKEEKLRRRASSGPTTPRFEATGRHDTRYTNEPFTPPASLGNSGRILQSVASKLSLRKAPDSNNASSSSKKNACVIFIYDPLGLDYGNSLYIIPRERLTEEHRHIFIAASSRNTSQEVFGADITHLRNRAAHLLSDDEKYLDFGQHRWPIERGRFKEYHKKQGANFNVGAIPSCQEFYLVIAPI